jgi:peptidyl-prolyl cis-trans isomerase A (cyclophilin A)
MLRRMTFVVLCCSLALAQGTKKSTTGAAKGPTSKPAAAEPTAIIHTTAGDMKCELFPDKAPKAVGNFIGLATGKKDWKDPKTGQTVHGKPLYDGVIFHRVIPNFMIQGGDPSGTGSGDVGFTFEDEPNADLLYDRPGRLAMANRGPNTNSSQFFITEVPVPFLNPQPGRVYTIFGQCDDAAVALATKIAQGPCLMGPCTANNSQPVTPVKIIHIDIKNAGAAAAKSGAKKKSAAAKKPSAASTPK